MATEKRLCENRERENIYIYIERQRNWDGEVETEKFRWRDYRGRGRDQQHKRELKKRTRDAAQSRQRMGCKTESQNSCWETYGDGERERERESLGERERERDSKEVRAMRAQATSSTRRLWERLMSDLMWQRQYSMWAHPSMPRSPVILTSVCVTNTDNWRAAENIADLLASKMGNADICLDEQGDPFCWNLKWR